MSATSACASAEDCLEVEPLPIDGARCDEAVCSTFGLGCSEAGCSASDIPPLCDVPFAQECAGALVASCALERVDGMWLQAHIDCSKAGMGCAFEGLKPRCAGEGGCAPTDGDVNVCSDESIHLCLQGIPVDFECESVGLSCVGADLKSGISGRCQ